MADLQTAAAIRKFCWLIALCLFSAMLTGCGSPDTSRFPLVVIGEPDDPFESGVRLPLAAQLTRASTTGGLVSFDEQGRVVPALADRWIVTDDGRSYIFRLRDGEWLDGEPLTAKSAKKGLDAAIRAVRNTPLGLDLAGVDEIRVMAGRVIEVRLLRPMPYFLQLLAQPELGLLHEKRGDGPMVLEREGDTALFTPIEPGRLGLPEIPEWEERVRQVAMMALPAEQAVQRFNEGQADLVLGGRIQDFPLTNSVGILRGTIQLDPVMGLFGLQIANDEGFLADPQNREALAMAIDRPSLIEPFGVNGWTPSTRLLPTDLDGELENDPERWADLSLAERRAAAAQRVRNWANADLDPDADDEGKARSSRDGSSVNGGATPQQSKAPELSIWLPSGPGSDILFNRLSGDFRTIGVASQRVEDPKDADLRLVDEVARYPRAHWFLNRLSCVARQGLCEPEVDALVAEAIKLEDSAERTLRLNEAEARLTQANVFIPLGSPIRWSLVRGSVQGFSPNPWAWHPLMPLAWLHR
ncbi:ABC transporter substrate-binding protein [Novosphingobium sp. M1R2S20]|uniref:ABC transporter substrate-binding protein n=1 Tax=Novosphingobium rhizovicinum TaxID=3228928 RepID=A0ABV3RA83_9SPHN